MEFVASKEVWIVLVAFLALTIVSGVISTRKKMNDMTDYFVAGRNMPPLLVAFSVAATCQSGSQFIGVPGLSYLLGYAPLVGINLLAGIPGMILCNLILAKPMRYISEKFGALTVVDVLDVIYRDKQVRWIGSLTILVATLVYTVVQWVAVGTLFQTLLGSSYFVGVLIGFAIVGFYVSFGGQRSNIIIDTIQLFVMMFGCVTVLFFAVRICGGFTEMNLALKAVDPKLVTVSGTIGSWGIFSFMMLYLVGMLGQPHITTRFFTVKKTEMLKWVLGITVVAYSTTLFSPFAGLAMRALTQQGVVSALPKTDMAMPAFLAIATNPYIGGLIAAAAVAAIMSTASTFLVTASSTITRDLLEQVFRIDCSGNKGLRYGRWATIFVAAITFIIAVNPPDIVFWLGNAAWGMFAAALTPALLLGIRWRRATAQGAKTSMLLGLILALGLYILKITKIWILPLPIDTGVFSMFVSFAVFFIVSLATPNVEKEFLPKRISELEQGSLAKVSV